MTAMDDPRRDDEDAYDSEYLAGEEYVEGNDYVGSDEYELREDSRLDLDEDDRLPWLENDYDEDTGGSDTARILGFALLGVLAIALLVGGIWYFTRAAPEGDLVADGSTIEAPEGPFKTRPDDPGGTEVEGTGDTSFTVGEGQTGEGRLADDDAAPRPSVDTRSTADTSDAGAATRSGDDSSTASTSGASASAPASSTASAAAGTLVQIAALGSKSAADARWRELQGRSSALSGKQYRVVEAQADIGTVYRLQVLAGSAEGARSLCASLKSDGLDCLVK